MPLLLTWFPFYFITHKSEGKSQNCEIKQFWGGKNVFAIVSFSILRKIRIVQWSQLLFKLSFCGGNKLSYSLSCMCHTRLFVPVCRIGHSRMRHKFLIPEDLPKCSYCQNCLSLKHVLLSLWDTCFQLTLLTMFLNQIVWVFSKKLTLDIVLS